VFTACGIMHRRCCLPTGSIATKRRKIPLIFGRKNLEEIDHLQDGGIILKSVLEKYDRGELYDSSCSEY